MRVARAIGFVLLVMHASPAFAAGSPVQIEWVESGRTPAGQPWFRVGFAEPYPPLSLEEWYAAVTIRTARGRYQFSVRRRGSDWDRWFVDERRRPAGSSIESSLGDGSLLVVLPVRVGRRARFVVESAAKMNGEVATDRWGVPERPKRVGAKVADPFLLFGPGTLVADMARPATRPPSDPPGESDGGSPLAAVALGALLGASGLVLVKPPAWLGRARAAIALAAGALAGFLLSLAIPIAPLPATAVGLGSVMSLLVAAPGAPLRRFRAGSGRTGAEARVG